jgi:hypothetical protein
MIYSILIPHAAILPEDNSDEENLGPELVDDDGQPYQDVYAPGCVNEWSWTYCPEQDPFGTL